MKIIKRFILIWTMIFVFPALSTVVVSHEKPISLQIKSLTRWKKSGEAKAIRQALGAMLKPRAKHPRYTEPFKGAKQYTATLFKKPFLVLDAESSDFGGFFALVVFENHPKVFSLWVYEIERNVFELREVEPLRVTLNKIVIDELKDNQIRPFWLSAVTK